MNLWIIEEEERKWNTWLLPHDQVIANSVHTLQGRQNKVTEVSVRTQSQSYFAPWMASAHHKITLSGKEMHPRKEDFTCFIPCNPYKSSVLCVSLLSLKRWHKTKVKMKSIYTQVSQLSGMSVTCPVLWLFLSSGRAWKIMFSGINIVIFIIIVPSHRCLQYEHHWRARFDVRYSRDFLIFPLHTELGVLPPTLISLHMLTLFRTGTRSCLCVLRS